ncbi:5-formyltetrahydrofolate cyclo-ligase, partial [Streptomyces synnematoformans]|uniref:5-formyltetrahydrofolate cyclo-ligase n=1 Tax=Streptomyces synnematoformans TaxID=415721 RepID=UPI0031D14A65
LLPGLAVDGRGMRLGRGGGSYDRVLARLAEPAAAAEPAGAEGPAGLAGGGGIGDGDGDRGTAGAGAGGGAALVVLLYDGEVLDRVPAEPHDRPVTAAVTPSAVHRFLPPQPQP